MTYSELFGLVAARVQEINHCCDVIRQAGGQVIFHNNKN